LRPINTKLFKLFYSFDAFAKKALVLVMSPVYFSFPTLGQPENSPAYLTASLANKN